MVQVRDVKVMKMETEHDIDNRESACGGKGNKLSACGEGEDDGSPSK